MATVPRHQSLFFFAVPSSSFTYFPCFCLLASCSLFLSHVVIVPARSPARSLALESTSTSSSSVTSSSSTMCRFSKKRSTHPVVAAKCPEDRGALFAANSRPSAFRGTFLCSSVGSFVRCCALQSGLRRFLSVRRSHPPRPPLCFSSILVSSASAAEKDERTDGTIHVLADETNRCLALRDRSSIHFSVG